MAIKPATFRITIDRTTEGLFKASPDRIKPRIYDRIVFSAPNVDVLIIVNTPNFFPTQTFVVEQGKNLLLEVLPNAPDRETHFLLMPLEQPFIPNSGMAQESYNKWVDNIETSHFWITDLTDPEVLLLLETNPTPVEDVETRGISLTAESGKPRNPRRK